MTFKNFVCKGILVFAATSAWMARKIYLYGGWEN